MEYWNDGNEWEGDELNITAHPRKFQIASERAREEKIN